MADSDDEPITLSAQTLAALAEFNAEKHSHAEKLARLKAEAEKNVPLSMEAFAEDWNESQFWYSDETAEIYSTQLLDGATSDMTIGVISAPTAFVRLKNILRTKSEAEQPRLVLLEHDERFTVFSEFVFYDFQHPLKLPAELKGSCDRIICDPPFLSEDCQTKSALTARWLLKTKTGPGSRVIVSTGERMGTLVCKLYQSIDVKTTTYDPVHARGLSNEFHCYANFECEHWKWR